MQLAVAIVGAIPVCVAVNVLIERVAYRRLRGALRRTTLITAIGISGRDFRRRSGRDVRLLLGIRSTRVFLHHGIDCYRRDSGIRRNEHMPGMVLGALLLALSAAY